jgi:hypothetical protein
MIGPEEEIWSREVRVLTNSLNRTDYIKEFRSTETIIYLKYKGKGCREKFGFCRGISLL